MIRIGSILFAIVLIAMPLLALQDANALPTETVEGVVGTVALVFGKGLCYLTVKPASGGDAVPERKVILGSMRYVMDQGFSPRAGDAIKVVGFPMSDESLAAARIDLPGKKQSVKFRDDSGRPVWSGGRGPGLGGQGKGAGPGGGGRGPRNRGTGF